MTQLTKQALALQRTLYLQDWRVRVRRVEGYIPDDAHLGDCEIHPDYKTATILLYPDAIAYDARSTESAVLLHEFGEIVAAQACSILSEETYNSDALVRVRDRFAEQLSLIMEPLL